MNDLKIYWVIKTKIIKKLENKNITDTFLSNDRFDILLDTYNTLKQSHYNKNQLDENAMIYWAIEWLAAWTNDKYTTFFQPIKSKDFNDNISWEFVWIWAYVEMEKPWLFKIISPLADSPAEISWLKWWDIVLKVDNKEITKDISSEQAISWIKWVENTTVTLTVKRWTEILTFDIIRKKIIVKDLESKVINNSTYYMKLRLFSSNIAANFKTSLEEINKNPSINKIIIDLRNNPGWYLDQVEKMLDYVIDEWNPAVVIKYLNSNEVYTTSITNSLDLNKYKVIILQNSGSASASEILTISLKDYFPNLIIVWEKSYWKWSVQTIKEYFDWSSLKYTIAKWYSWKTQTWIDWVWIKADREVLDDEKTEIDEVLEYAKGL